MAPLTRASWLFAAALVGCLPEDTREPPGVVTVKLRGSDETIDGFDTADGWHVQFERVVVTVGAAEVSGCTQYTRGDYLRIVDGRAREPQLLGVAYGLGSCGIELRAGNANEDTLLGAGISEADEKRMLEFGSDPYQVERARATFWIRGRADRNGMSKAFEWIYRRRGVAYECALPAPLQLTADVSLGVEFSVHGAALFEDPTGVRRFDRFAAADVDGDGTLTLEELEKTPEAGPLRTLGRFLYEVAFPAIIRVGESGSCKPRLGGDPRGPD